MFILFLVFLYPKEQDFRVKEVISPTQILLDNNNIFKISDYETFDPVFSEKNKKLAKDFNLSEEEAFVMGNFGKYWAKNLLEGRSVNIQEQTLYYQKFNYLTKFKNSPYCIKDNHFCNEKAGEKLISTIKHTNYVLLDVETDKIYPISKEKQNLLVIKKGYRKKFKTTKPTIKNFSKLNLSTGNIKLILTDFTVKLKPDRNCSTDLCREILTNINNAQSSIDMAIYGYSSTPAIENAIKNALKRGVKIRMVYDSDKNGNNIYEDTQHLAALIKNTKSDIDSANPRYIMHNKFFIIDNKTVITGSANLSYTDMSGYNTNALLVINSKDVAKLYKNEFEQMYNGKFHNEKIAFNKGENIFFSPQDKTITNCIIPAIQQAKSYIYIPSFIIIENQIINELIKAKNRGVDVKIIADALNASNKYSKINQLRASGLPVKIENYAGKLHSKTMIIDDKYLIIGSMNFSYSGQNRNDENLIILENSQAAILYRNFFEYLWKKIPDKWLRGFPRAEGLDSIGSCSDGLDNDYDGLIDGEDEGCKK